MQSMGKKRVVGGPVLREAVMGLVCGKRLGEVRMC